jgi:signal peptidase II
MAGQSILALTLLLGALWSRKTIHIAGLGIAAGGAIGNILDRWTWGAVADFLNVSCCGIDNPWSFNIADIAVFGGLALLLWPSGAKAGETAPQ